MPPLLGADWSTMSVRVTIESSEFAATALLVRELSGREAISELFWFEVTLAPAAFGALVNGVGESGKDGPPLAGHGATLVFSQGRTVVRKVHGVIAECTEQLDGDAPSSSYRIRLLPHLHRLSLVKLQRVIVDHSVPQVLEEKLTNVGLSGSLRLQETYAPETLTVQYKESDLDFLRRLSEHEGISFFFEHGECDGSSATDRIVFSDTNETLAPSSEKVRLPFQRRGERTGVFRLDRQTRMAPNYFVVVDYNEQRPANEIVADHVGAEEGGGGVIEYGSNHSSIEQGKRLARVRAEESAAASDGFAGASDAVGLTAPCHLEVEDERRGTTHELLVTEVEHRVAYGVGTDGARALRYENTFRAIPFAQPFRPARVTRKPRIHGFVTGLIEAAFPEVRQPWLDDQGRYGVHLHFDFSPAIPAAAYAVRMAQPSAASRGSYGMHFPLRPGTEVLIGFIDGDPDRPIIVGALPNAHAPSPVTSADPRLSRIVSARGVVFELNDGD